MAARRLALAVAALLALPAFAHAQSAALVEKPIVTGHCAAWSATHANMIKDSGVGCASGQVRLNDGVHPGDMMLAPAMLFFPNSPGILNNTSQQPLILSKGVATTGTDAGDFKCYRDANYTGGTPGFVNPCFFTYTVARAGSTSFEWSGLDRLDNYGTAADASQNVARYIQGRKYSTGSTWAGVTELYDYTANPTTGSVTDEHDMTATGTDNNNGRVLFDGWLRNISGTSTVEAAYGIRLNTDTGGFWKNGVYLAGSYGNGINLAAGGYTGGALVLADSQKVCVTAGCGQYLSHFSSALNYVNGAAVPMAITDSGALTVTGGMIAAGLNTTGNIGVNSGSKFCVDGATCAAYLTGSLGGINLYTASTSRVSLDSAGTLTTGGILASGVNTTGNVGVNAGSKVCLDGATCAVNLTEASSVTTLNSSGGVLLPGTIATGLQVTGNILGTTQTLTGTLTGVTGAFSGAVSGTTITGSSTVQGATVTTTGNVIAPTNGKICMNGASCTIYATFDGTNLIFSNAGSSKFLVVMSTGQVVTAAGYTSTGSLAGVTCSGITAATVTVNGGIVTHC